jgi:hypothetical protein
MMTGLDFKSAQFYQVRGELAENWICEVLKSSPVRIELEDLKWQDWHLTSEVIHIPRTELIFIQSYMTGSIYFTRDPVLSCKQTKAIGLANLLMNY